jgi:hypothetical protein
MSMVWLLLVPGLQAATPDFVGEPSRAARIARNAWEAAEACTGWAAPSHAQVDILNLEELGPQLVTGHRDAEGLYQLTIHGRKPDPLAIAREVAHSWIGEGPSALTVGRSELLVDCIAAEHARAVPRVPDDGRPLDAMPNLLTWESARRGQDTRDPSDPTSAGWWGAARLLRLTSQFVEPKHFWPQTRLLGWDEFAALLLASGDKGEPVMALLAAATDEQRTLLSDLDRDGLPLLGEQLLGTDPAVWDTDGDGWWDGAKRPELAEAVPLPPDGLPVCLAAGGNGPMGGVVLDVGGNLRGLEVPNATLLMKTRSVDLVTGSNYHRVPSGRPAVVRLGGELGKSTGGVWVAPVGSKAQIRTGCMADDRMVVWASNPSQRRSVQEFHTLSVAAHKRAEALLGPTRVPLTVQLGDSQSWVESNTVGLSLSAMAWADSTGRLDWLAAVAVALWRTDARLEPSLRYEQAEALARALIDDAPEDLVVAENWREVNQWTRVAEDCESGWRGLLVDGACWIE